MLRVLWQVGKQQEIEAAGHKPQMLAQHGILLDTDLHQDPLSEKASSENRRWEAEKSHKRLSTHVNVFFFFLTEVLAAY